MRPSFKSTASTALLLTLTACTSMPAKKTTTTQMPRLSVPSAATDPLNIRSEADYNFILAEMYSREGKSERAIDAYKKVAALDPAAAAVQMRLSAEYLSLQKTSDSIRHAEVAVQKDPQNIEAHLVLGGLYSTEKSYDKAIAQYKEVLRLQPENSEAPIYIGSLYADKKDFKKAEQHFTSLLKNPQYDSPHEIHYYIGLMRMDQDGTKFHRQAEEAFKASLRLKPGFEDSAVALANLYLQQGQREKALAVCLEFQKLDHFSYKVADLIAQIYIENGQSEEAYAQLDLIAGNNNSSHDVQLKMALILIEQKKLTPAADRLRAILTQHPQSDSARYYLAAIHEETGATESAVQEYLRIPGSSRHFSEAIVHAAHLLKVQGKLNQALAVTAQGLKAKADKPQVYTMYASLLDAKSDYLGAAQILEKGLTKYSQNAELLYHHAIMLDRLGKKANMIEQMKKVLEIEPNHIQGMSYLAFTFAELNEHLAEAERLARRALELDPQDGYVLDTLGWVLFKQKKFSESIKVLEKAFASQASASIIAEHLADAYSMHSQPVKAKEMYEKAADLAGDANRASRLRKKMQSLAQL